MHRISHFSTKASAVGSLLFGVLAVLLSGPSAIRVEAQSTLKISTNYYAVTGSSIREILQSINRVRPAAQLGAMHAFTEWKVDWRFTTETSSNGCVQTGFVTDVVITTLLPRWIPASDVAPEVVQQWDRYIGALAEHERGHAALATQAAAEMSRRAAEVGEVSTCSALTRQLNAMGVLVLEEYREKEKKYDEQTRHGASQGAILRASREGRPR